MTQLESAAGFHSPQAREGRSVLGFVGWVRHDHSQNTPLTLSHWSFLNLIFRHNLFPVLKKHDSSTLVHYHLGDCLSSVILTAHKLIALDFLVKSPSRFPFSSFFFF